MHLLLYHYLKSLKRLKTTLSCDHCEEYGQVISVMDENTKLINLFAEIMESKKVNKYQIQKIFNAILIHSNERKGIGELYDFQRDKFVIQLVKLFEKQEAIQKKEDELWGDESDLI